MRVNRVEIDGIEFRWDSEWNIEKRIKVEGWFWLDASRGVYNGPFENQHLAYEDAKTALLLTRPI
jgi:hypothetical protein